MEKKVILLFVIFLLGISFSSSISCSEPPIGCPVFDNEDDCVGASQECPTNINYVCGVNGNIYDNTCSANALGINVRCKQACPCPCKEIINSTTGKVIFRTNATDLNIFSDNITYPPCASDYILFGTNYCIPKEGFNIIGIDRKWISLKLPTGEIRGYGFWGWFMDIEKLPPPGVTKIFNLPDGREVWSVFDYSFIFITTTPNELNYFWAFTDKSYIDRSKIDSKESSQMALQADISSDPNSNCEQIKICISDSQCNDNNVNTLDKCINGVCVSTPTQSGNECGLMCQWIDDKCFSVYCFAGDKDYDTICDDVDNCPPLDIKLYGWGNQYQEDSDNDRIGDACDPDFDANTDGDHTNDCDIYEATSHELTAKGDFDGDGYAGFDDFKILQDLILGGNPTCYNYDPHDVVDCITKDLSNDNFFSPPDIVLLQSFMIFSTKEYCLERTSEPSLGEPPLSCSDQNGIICEGGLDCLGGQVIQTEDSSNCCKSFLENGNVHCGSFMYTVGGDIKTKIEETNCRGINEEGVGRKLITKRLLTGDEIESYEVDCTVLPEESVPFYSLISVTLTILILISFYAFRRKEFS